MAKKQEKKEEDFALPKPTVAIFEQPEAYTDSFDLEFILDVLRSEYSAKAKACLTRDSGATLLYNTYRPILTAEGLGGIRREVVFSYMGSYYKVSAICQAQDNQAYIDWDAPALEGEATQVMAQRVDPVTKQETVYLPTAR